MAISSNARYLTAALGATVSLTLGLRADEPPDFKADATFTGSSLAGWQQVGQAAWRAENGTLVGRATGEAGGWLMSDTPLQDLQFFANLQCASPCKAGVLFRAEKTATGLRGVYVSFSDGDLVSYLVTLDGQGRETARTRIGNPPAAGSAAATAAAAAGMAAGAWNPLKVNLWNETVRTWPGSGGVFADQGATTFGPFALYVGGGEVRYKDVAWKDVNAVELPEERSDSVGH
jgi:hypothetical protein